MSAKPYHQVREEVPAPTGCPVEHTWSPLSAEYLDDPYAIASDLRERAPVFYAESLGYVVVTRMEDIEAIFTDHDTFASVNVQDPVFPLCEEAAAVLAAEDFNPIAVMSNSSNPDHARIRKFTREGFSNRRLEVLGTVYSDTGTRTGGCDACRVSAHGVYSGVRVSPAGRDHLSLYRIPGSRRRETQGWCGDRKAFSWGRPDRRQQVEIAQQMLAYWRYCRNFTAAKRDEPGDDFTSELLAAHAENPELLSYREVESIVYGLSFAGHEAVTALICNCLLCLLPRREQWARLCADTSAIPNAVEEVLRFESSQISWRRVTTRDTTIRGVDVPAGTPVFLNFAGANRQPEVFDDPDNFDIARDGARKHISFGKGIHFCLGARMAREEARIVLEVLTERVPSLALVDGQDIHAFPNVTFRGPERLEVSW